MKNKNVKRFIIILLMIFSIFKIICSNIEFDSIKNDDYLFLKFLTSDKKDSADKSKQDNIYKFSVNYKNMDFKSINLLNTVDKLVSVNKKIAPGSTGKFEIELSSDNDLEYKIEFKSKNEKPQNLKFEVMENNNVLAMANTLEELSENMNGNIRKNQKIVYKIKWYWEFQDSQGLEKTDVQDTKDAKNIKQYNFDVCTYGNFV